MVESRQDPLADGLDGFFDWLVSTLQAHPSSDGSPAVSRVARRSRDPFRVLVATVLSARTRDENTARAADALFELASTPAQLATIPISVIEQAIRPANFYKTKALRLHEIAVQILDRFGGKVPDAMEELLCLPGVGRKTANLVLSEGFGLDGICVDTHVHRILNRLGAVQTRHPHETEAELRRVLPKRHWRVLNPLLVTFGQAVCRPLSPICSQCPLAHRCKRFGVARHR